MKKRVISLIVFVIMQIISVQLDSSETFPIYFKERLNVQVFNLSISTQLTDSLLILDQLN